MQSFTLPNPPAQREPLDLSLFDGTSTLSRADSHGALGQRRQNLPHIVAFWEKEQRDDKAAERGEPIDDSIGPENRRPLSTVPEDSPRSPIAGIDEVLTNALAAEAKASLDNDPEVDGPIDGWRTTKSGDNDADDDNRHEPSRTDTTVSASPTMFMDYDHSLARTTAADAIQAIQQQWRDSLRTPPPRDVPDDTFTTPLDSIGLRNISLDDSLMNISSATTLAPQAATEPRFSQVRSASSSYPSEGIRTPPLVSDPASPSRSLGRRVFSSFTRSPGRISSLLHCYTDSSSGANSTDTRHPLLPLSGVHITEHLTIEVNNRSEVDSTDFGETADIRHEPENAEIDTLPPSGILAIAPPQSSQNQIVTSRHQPPYRVGSNNTLCLDDIGTVGGAYGCRPSSDESQVADSRASMTCLPRQSCVFDGTDDERTDDASMLRLQAAVNISTAANDASNTTSSTNNTTDSSAIRASSIAAGPGTPYACDTNDGAANADLSTDAPEGRKSSFAERVKRHKSAASLRHCIRHSSVGNWLPRRKTTELERSNKIDSTAREQRRKSHPATLSRSGEPGSGVTPSAVAALVDGATGGEDETQLEDTWLSTNTTHMTGALPVGARKSGTMARFKDRAGKVGAIAKGFGKKFKAKMHLWDGHSAGENGGKKSRRRVSESDALLLAGAGPAAPRGSLALEE